MHANNHGHHVSDSLGSPFISQVTLSLPFLAALLIYLAAVIVLKRRQKSWPLYRTVFWVIGVFSALTAVIGPLANQSHTDFTAHMLGHLLLGMLAPLLMVLAAPMTILFKTLPISASRRLSRVLRSKYLRFISDPVTASVLNIGGLWLLYTTSLYSFMHESTLLHVLIHLHVFLAGYLFTASMIYIDPMPHRTSYIYRSAVFVIALAGHGILSKYLYAHPPNGVPAAQAEKGSVLMYYGGDYIDILLIIILCFQWYQSSRPRGIDTRASFPS